MQRHQLLFEYGKFCKLCSLPCLQKAQKQILTNVSGIFRTGMNAIMGPTGCGKASLLDLLADRKDREGFEGEILLNGQPRTQNYKYHVGYVVQDDIICGNLTVKENLMFSANTSPPLINIIFNNTSKFNYFCLIGLDSSMARSVMECLHQLSRTGCTIVFSIHQPRYSIFKLFDTLFLLSAGRCTYHGRTGSVLNLFSSVGFSCEEHNNPADFLLDITQGDRPQLSAQQQDDIAFNEESFANLAATLFCALTLVFGGFLVEMSSAVVFLRWIQYFSLVRYGSSALLVNESISLTLCVSNNTSIRTKTSADVLSELIVDHGRSWAYGKVVLL
ncbi:unnamed protein product [Rotaria socialis]|uniref:ABC transporter domain-containing protein n=1 Tax=Rotaria socialis TaxID=392032 RepID=A0A821CAY8_9BILA|nr:unnamed protein product [Rotaria socialis]